ncbi:hypothetical protein LJR230_000056 [Trinickia sp. LjRoot230]|uniref:hypothetical protein n=1 Tax=Trinickia sp. LjRoot230 TaxID=3342288 RepID=UPI003ECCF96D
MPTSAAPLRSRILAALPHRLKGNDTNGARRWGVSTSVAVILFGFAATFGAIVAIDERESAQQDWQPTTPRDEPVHTSTEPVHPSSATTATTLQTMSSSALVALLQRQIEGLRDENNADAQHLNQVMHNGRRSVRAPTPPVAAASIAATTPVMPRRPPRPLSLPPAIDKQSEEKYVKSEPPAHHRVSESATPPAAPSAKPVAAPKPAPKQVSKQAPKQAPIVAPLADAVAPPAAVQQTHSSTTSATSPASTAPSASASDSEALTRAATATPPDVSPSDDAPAAAASPVYHFEQPGCDAAGCREPAPASGPSGAGAGVPVATNRVWAGPVTSASNAAEQPRAKQTAKTRSIRRHAVTATGAAKHPPQRVVRRSPIWPFELPKLARRAPVTQAQAQTHGELYRGH